MKHRISQIAGDASFRKFYRIIENKKSKIIVFANKEKYKNLIAYSAVNQFLRDNNILAPKLFKHNFKAGSMLIEDFGNLSFHKVLLKKKNKFSTYKQLINLLLKIQTIKPKPHIKSIKKKMHLINKYTEKYLHKESDLFLKWYLPTIVNEKKIPNLKSKIKKILSKIYKKINFPNSHFVHRDFHVQNLMKIGRKIGVIDSQDALIGNPAYDLVSLIDDVRITTSKKLKQQILNYYLKRAPGVNKHNAKSFLKDFNILSVQRNLKIIGIFTRLFIRDKKDEYLKFIPYAWSLLESRMQDPIFTELKSILELNIKKSIRFRCITLL